MDKINTLNINGIPTNDCQKMANEFNKYFSTIAKSINTKQNKLNLYNVDNTTPPPLLNPVIQESVPKH
jgi:hypothetical protein